MNTIARQQAVSFSTASAESERQARQHAYRAEENQSTKTLTRETPDPGHSRKCWEFQVGNLGYFSLADERC